MVNYIPFESDAGRHYNKYTVRISEVILESGLINETAEELHELKLLAKMLMDALPLENIDEPKYATKFLPMAQVEAKIKSKDILDMYYFMAIYTQDQNLKERGSCYTNKVPVDVKNGKIITAIQNVIWLKPTNNIAQMTSTLAHELQHALDHWKGAINIKKDPYPEKPGHEWTDSDVLVYLRNPKEVNARFTQAMAEITEQMVKVLERGGKPKQDTKAISIYLNNLFIKWDLNRPMLIKGPKGDKAYKQLLKRGIMFYKYIIPILEKDLKNNVPTTKDKIIYWTRDALSKVKRFFLGGPLQVNLPK